MRPIDADALLEHVKDLPTWWGDAGGVYGPPMKYPQGMFDVDDIVSSIENAPTTTSQIDMDYKELVEHLERRGLSNPSSLGPHSGLYEQAATAITDLLSCLEMAMMRAVQEKSLRQRVEQERDASIKELNRVSDAVDNLSDFIDNEVYPVVEYNLYSSLRDDVDAITKWLYESEWARGEVSRNDSTQMPDM